MGSGGRSGHVWKWQQTLPVASCPRNTQSWSVQFDLTLIWMSTEFDCQLIKRDLLPEILERFAHFCVRVLFAQPAGCESVTAPQTFSQSWVTSCRKYALNGGCSAISLTTLGASNFPVTVSTQADSVHSWLFAPLPQRSASIQHKECSECLPNHISSSFDMWTWSCHWLVRSRWAWLT